MKTPGSIVRLIVVLVALFAFVGVNSAAAADETATITIHKSTCPANTGADIFDRCHKNALTGVSFDIGGEGVVTDGAGHATAVVGVGPVTITEDSDDAADFVGAYVFCSVQGAGTVLTDGRVNNRTISINTTVGQEVICDWYNLTAPAAVTPTVTTSPAPTTTATSVPVVHPTATSTSGTTTTLPNTGAGATGGSGTSTFWIAGMLVALVVGAFSIRRRRLS